MNGLCVFGSLLHQPQMATTPVFFLNETYAITFYEDNDLANITKSSPINRIE